MNQALVEYLFNDIPEDFFDAGNSRYKTNLLFKIKHVAIVEVFTGNVYKYHAVNYLTKEKKYLFFTKKSIPKSKHCDIAEKIIELTYLFETNGNDTESEERESQQNSNQKNECIKEKSLYKSEPSYLKKQFEANIHKLLERIVQAIFPRYGFSNRVHYSSQFQLYSLNEFLNKSIAFEYHLKGMLLVGRSYG
jgi:hypothetical protein